MAAREIRIYGDPVLREKALPVEAIDNGVRRLAADMRETLDAAEGVGLAGPQVGALVRIILYAPPRDDEDERSPANVLLNPEIVERRGPSVSAEEGCLSIPGIYEDVKRPAGIRIRGLDLDGETVEFEAEGMLARILQHEVDHLDGVLFIDKIGPLRRSLLKKRLRELTMS